MKQDKRWVLHGAVLAWSATLAACASGPVADPIAERLAFTDGLIREYSLSEPHKRRLQYYTSEHITLSRAASDGLRGIGDGKLIERGRTSVDNIEIPAGSPGVVVGSGPNWLAVSFQQGSYLYFVSSQAQVNSPYWNDLRDEQRYYLYAPDWDGRAGSVRLGNTAYQAVGGSIDSFLLVDREALFDANARSNTLPGRWLDGRPR